jgi:predicted NBD/HSP70 family sugar kinase
VGERAPGTPRLLRALNDRAALDLLIAHGPLTRTRVGELTGLSKVTASQLLARLQAAGLVDAVGEDAGGRGPNAQLYAVVGSAGVAAGVDVDPQRVAARIVDLAGTVLGEAVEPVPQAVHAQDPATDVRRALDASMASAGRRVRRPGAVVIGVQGAYHPARDALAHAEHMPAWSRSGLDSALTSACACPIRIENDVNLAAMAEPAPAASSAFLWLGDGLGLAIRLGGLLHRGAGGGAGEVGYIRVPGPDGLISLQELLGAPAVLTLARAYGLTGRTAATVVGRAGRVPGKQSPAGSFLTDLAARIATGLATIVAVLDPDEVLLGGPVGTAGGDRLAGKVGNALTAVSPIRPPVRVTTTVGNPVLAGATALALADLREQMFTGTAPDNRTGARA